MEDHDVDRFGMSDADVPQEGRAPAPPDMSVERLSNEESPSPRSSAVSASEGANVAGKEIDQSHNKNDYRGAVIYSPELIPDLARSMVGDRNGRGLQDPEALRRLAENYVAPDGLLETRHGQGRTALDVLVERRVVLVSAPGDECGQLSACLRLSYELQRRKPDLIVREELMDQTVRLHPATLLATQEPAAILIDLRGSDGADLQAIDRGLVELTNHLQHYDSYLMLIIPPGTERSFEDRVPGRVHVLGKPDPMRVLAHITGVDASTLVDDTGVPEQLTDMWPPKVKAVAEAVRDATERGARPHRALHDALEQESSARPSELRNRILERQGEQDAEWIALLLAAATLETASSQHIAQAADQLLAHNEIPPPEPKAPLLRRSPSVRLQHLPTEWFDPVDRAFRARSFGTDVLRYFWDEHPDLHDPLLAWFGSLPRHVDDLERHDLEQLADRTVLLARQGGARIALGLATSWTKTADSAGGRSARSPRDRYRRSIAVRLLTTAATDSGLGKPVRQQLWHWARDGNTDLKLLTSEVCGGIGAAFPRIALTRLKHLAGSEDAEVRTSVLGSLQQIGTELGTSRFLRYLAEWFDDASPARLDLMSQGVHEVLTDLPGTVDPEAAEGFWRHAIDTMPPKHIKPLVESWLHVAAQLHVDQRGEMVEPLVQATGPEFNRIAQVKHASKPESSSLDLSGVSSGLADVVRQLWIRLEEIDPVWGRE
ncbi:hypothetical protein IQ251_13020 [Saccharopolyspora sp. HNM0983]|uniref:Uncharacterized protein n=1 Tax=Saccharopolyspora montiporae TaxID=2781240 RepID=A0A929G245_9PSEU|nr:hypothetical protein [Saccharopolyspora sp. HNM0983]MBE9375368.1 hypothetical protein [Saccharopolyspora sp. HNM0983]